MAAIAGHPVLRRAAAVLAALSFGFLLACLVLALAGLRDRPGRGRLIVVPGNTVLADGSPSPRLRARLEAALVLYRDGSAPAVFVSGGIGREGFNEAAVMAAWLVERGVPPEAIVQDPYGIDTAATARNAAAWLRDHGGGSALVATQYFHVPRTVLALEREGVRVAGHVHPAFVEARDLYAVPREVAAYAAYRWRSPAP